MITKSYKLVKLGAAPTVTTPAAETKVTWALKPTSTPAYKDATLSGSTSAVGFVYCFV
jgi:hypothetical protein